MYWQLCCGCDGVGCEEVTGTWETISGTWTGSGSTWDCTSAGVLMFTPAAGLSSDDRMWWSGRLPPADGGYIFDAVDEDNCHRVKRLSGFPNKLVFQEVSGGVVTDIETRRFYEADSFFDWIEIGKYLHLTTPNWFFPADSYTKKGGNKFGLFYEGASSGHFELENPGILPIGRSLCAESWINPAVPTISDFESGNYLSLFARNNGIRVYDSRDNNSWGADSGGSITAELNVSGFTFDPDFDCVSSDPCPCTEEDFSAAMFGPHELKNDFLYTAFTSTNRFLRASPDSIDCIGYIGASQFRWRMFFQEVPSTGYPEQVSGLYICNANGLNGVGYGQTAPGEVKSPILDLPAEIFKLVYVFTISSTFVGTTFTGHRVWYYESDPITLADMHPGNSVTMSRSDDFIVNPSDYVPPGTWSGGNSVTIYFNGP